MLQYEINIEIGKKYSETRHWKEINKMLHLGAIGKSYISLVWGDVTVEFLV